MHFTKGDSEKLPVSGGLREADLSVVHLFLYWLTDSKKFERKIQKESYFDHNEVTREVVHALDELWQRFF